MGIARLDVSVIVEVPTHGDADEVGVGRVISGLRPDPLTSVVPGGVVPSVNTGPVMVLDPGSVKSVVLTAEVSAGAIGVGLQMPDMLDVPNEDVTGSGATEKSDEDVNPDVSVALLEPTTTGVVTVLVAELVIPNDGHIVIAPRDAPGIGPKFPRLNCKPPNGLPVVPTVGIVPGTAVGDVMGVEVGDVMGVDVGGIVRVDGPPRMFDEPTWATAVPQPIKTTANIVKSKRFMKASLTAVGQLLAISGSSASVTAAPCCRRRG